MKILALGDIVGERAVAYLRENLPTVKKAEQLDVVIANAENVCEIHGLSANAAGGLFDCGIDFLTSGNHIFDRRDVYTFLDDCPFLTRPCNYPPTCPGEGSRILTTPQGWRALIVNVSGCVFMDALNDPFHAVEAELDRMSRKYDFAILDIHAEATSEKLALAHCFDGQFAAIFGTHTHVPTADEQILPKGTGYITDLGMTGPSDGILGVKCENVIEKFRTHMPCRFHVAEGPIRANGAIFEIDPVGGRALSVKRLQF